MKQPMIVCASCGRRFRSLYGARRHGCKPSGKRISSTMPQPSRIPLPPDNKRLKEQETV